MKIAPFVEISRTARSRQNAARHRSGFTLFEVLLASGLSVLLLVAVYGALDLHWKYSTAGRDGIEQSQLARALFQKIATDIREVVYLEKNSQEEEDDSDDTNGDTDNSEQVVQIGGIAEEFSESGIGIVGNAETLVLHVNKPGHELTDRQQLESSHAWAQTTSGLQLVAWFGNRMELRQLWGLMNGETSSPLVRSHRTEDVAGIARFKHEWRTLGLDLKKRDAKSLEQFRELIAEEVSELGFRYFDGVEWLESWDSVLNESLPRAIEISIGFLKKVEISQRSRPKQSLSNRYRFVVVVPLSPPYATQTENRKTGHSVGVLKPSS